MPDFRAKTEHIRATNVKPAIHHRPSARGRPSTGSGAGRGLRSSGYLFLLEKRRVISRAFRVKSGERRVK
ncbi:hypothetical protein C6I21_07650 [Alkalicoccus urumqiensis]|uniref:Uncharacterized protein n=1 Tax=Alkalicoccus urumqiensis TaxID=1548213 RepID=A0A2P6MHM8_ALKUR|nr:hypothetical protein C6I21_07650 [Alkalicoccus urumqiensis]